MENKQGNSYTEWFTVLKVPILKITIEDQVFFFSPTRRINTPGELLKMLKEDAWRIIDAEKAHEASFHEEARLFDYFTGEGIHITVAVLTAETCWKQQREKARQIPIKFHVTLHDKLWSREKRITIQGILEVYSLRTEVHVTPSQGIPGYQEEVIIQGKKFERLQGLFTTPYEPFIPEDDNLFSELLHLSMLNSSVPRIKHHRGKKTLSGYMDITCFLER
jgi:hypothetical protein